MSDYDLEFSADKIEEIRRTMVDKIAKEILSVQPMWSNPKVVEAFNAIYENAMTEEELIAAGYEPISPDTRLMWRKKPNANE